MKASFLLLNQNGKAARVASVAAGKSPVITPMTGTVSNCRRTPLDECGHVYKDLDEVLGVLESQGIASVDRRMYPVANIKGA